MVKIAHYEVYSDKGDGWKLEDRFSSDQRHEAINLAKEKEQDKFAVKIIREIFDVQDNTYQETVEYISGLSNKNDKNSPDSAKINVATNNNRDVNSSSVIVASGRHISSAIIKLVVIIVLSLVFANVLVSLLVPVIEIFATEETAKNIMFVVFFIIFLILAVPLILKKVPWDAFVVRSDHNSHINDRKFFDKAEAIIRRYNLNDDYQETLAPTYPEAPLEYKRHIVDFLTQVITNLDSQVYIKDNFNKLGVKFIVYGGCLELSRYCGLIISEANSLLYEAFEIIDGKEADIQEFYEIKKAYKDNKLAIFLTGVGAYLMAQVIEEKPLDSNILKTTFARWEDLHRQNLEAEDNSKEEVEIVFTCLGNIKNTIRFYNEDTSAGSEVIDKIRGDVRNIIFSIISKYRGKNTIEKDDITSVQFSKLNDAIKFTIEVLKDIGAYQEASENQDVFIESRGAVLEVQTKEEVNLSPYIEDIFFHTYDNEIIVDDDVKKELAVGKYSVDFLGDKKLNKTKKTVALYKLIY